MIAAESSLGVDQNNAHQKHMSVEHYKSIIPMIYGT